MANMFGKLASPLAFASEGLEKLLQAKGIIEYGDEIRQLHAAVVAGLKDQATAEQKIQALEREVADLKASKAKLERYELKRLPHNALVMVLKQTERGTEEPHYACVNCHTDGKIKPLNYINTFRGVELFRCIVCGSEARIGNPTPAPTRASGTDFDVFSGR